MPVPSRTLLHVFPTFAVGGTQMRFARLVNHFGPRYRHLVVAMDGRRDAADLLAPGADVRMVDVPVRKGSTRANLGVFRRLLTSLRPDLLVTSNWGSIEWAMANWDAGVRHLHLEDGFGPEESGGQLRRRVWTRRIVLRRSTVLLPSLVLYRIAREVWRLPERRLIHVPNGVDCDRFASGPCPDAATARGIVADRPVIGTVAALRAEKNLHRLIDAFALIANRSPAQLVIVGDGPERAALEARADHLGLSARVRFTGACDTPEKLLPSFTLFALSSDTEQMPLSVLEAMAAGRSVAATDVGDVGRMVAASNRPFVSGHDAPSLAAALSALLDAPDKAAAIGADNARRARDVYDQQRMFEAYRRLFDGSPNPVVPVALE